MPGAVMYASVIAREGRTGDAADNLKEAGHVTARANVDVQS